MRKKYPQFIGIGASYSGMGIVATLLAAHPAVADSIPNLNFFNTDAYEKKGLIWYDSQFAIVTNKKIMGECSVGYLTSPKTVERIARDFPDAKLFAVLRHPIDRAIAEYTQRKATPRGSHYRSCAEYLMTVPNAQLAGLYGSALERYFSYYSSLQVYVIIYDDFVREPLKTIQSLYAYLEVDSTFIPAALLQFAPPSEPPKRRGFISRVIRFPFWLVRATYRLIKKKIKSKPAAFQVAFKPSDYFSRAELAPFNALYVKDAELLSNLVHRDMVAEWYADSLS